MYNVNSATTEALMSDSRSFRARLEFEHGFTITADQIYRVSTDWASADKDICPGQVVSNSMTAETAGDIGDLTSLTFKLYLTLIDPLTGESYEDIPMGEYKVLSCKKQGAKTLIEAHDKLYSLPDTTYISKLEYPATVYAVECEICDILGIGYPTIQCDMPIPNRVTCTIREMLGFCASLQGHFATLDRNGNLLTSWYTDSGYDISPSRAAEPEVEQQEIKYTKISVSGGESVLIYGTGDREMIFVNPYMTQEQLNAVAPSILAVSYKPMTVNHILSDPRLDVWDIVTVTAVGTLYSVPVTSIAHSYDGGLSAVVGAVGSTTEEAKTGEVKGPIKQAVADVTERVNVLEATAIDTDYLNANYAMIDLANIEEASITTAMIAKGAIKEAQIGDASITSAKIVEIDAAKISTGTLSVERLVIRGSEKSVVYQLNNITGALQAEEVDTLNGEIMTDRTILAEKIVAKSITSDEIAANTITANELNVNDIFSSRAVINTLTANQAFIQAVATNSVVVGAAMDIQKAKQLAEEQGITIGRWCYENDTTFINGGAIYTGTIDADKLNVNTLSAISANLGTVTAGVIRSSAYDEGQQGTELSLAGTGTFKTFKVTNGIKVNTELSPDGLITSREDTDGKKTCVLIDAFDSIKSGYVYVYYDGVATASMSGGYDGGFCVYNSAGKNTGRMYSSDYGGSLNLRRDNQSGLVYDALTFSSTASGGYLNMYHPANQATVIELSSLNSTGGQLNLYNALGAARTITLGSTGAKTGYIDVSQRQLANCDGTTLTVTIDKLSVNGGQPYGIEWKYVSSIDAYVLARTEAT